VRHSQQLARLCAPSKVAKFVNATLLRSKQARKQVGHVRGISRRAGFAALWNRHRHPVSRQLIVGCQARDNQEREAHVARLEVAA
jgi:hypothetical protein